MIAVGLEELRKPHRTRLPHLAQAEDRQQSVTHVAGLLCYRCSRLLTRTSLQHYADARPTRASRNLLLQTDRRVSGEPVVDEPVEVVLQVVAHLAQIARANGSDASVLPSDTGDHHTG